MAQDSMTAPFSSTGPKTAAILLAAGSSRRLGGGVPKPFLPVSNAGGGRLVVEEAASRLIEHQDIECGVIVVSTDWKDKISTLFATDQRWSVISGGAERPDSVRAGLEYLAETDRPDFVLIHDAARPLLPTTLCGELIQRLHNGASAVIPAIAVADTLKTVTDDTLAGSIDRNGAFQVQTPQGFDFGKLLELHYKAEKNRHQPTDDSSLFEAAGMPVHIIDGSPMLTKITTADDLAMIQTLAAGLERGADVMHETRTASGYDVHRFGTMPGPLMLCGLAVDHDSGVEAHSDGDVGLHALTDALLGAMAEGDIGHHFPPSDASWKDANSSVFLGFACDRLAKRGGRLIHADVTIICERPKISPLVTAMRTQLARLLGTETGRVSIKATTSEKLGFTGRGEGIAAMAQVTISLPTAPETSKQ